MWWGGLLRDVNGKVIFGFACSFGVGTSLEAEIKVMLHGIRLCRAKEILYFELESDSLTLVNMLKESTSCAWYLQHLVEEIHKFQQYFITISHCYRQPN